MNQSLPTQTGRLHPTDRHFFLRKNSTGELELHNICLNVMYDIESNNRNVTQCNVIQYNMFFLYYN